MHRLLRGGAALNRLPVSHRLPVAAATLSWRRALTDLAAQPLEITARCAQRIVDLSNKSSERILRISVEPGGCSGFQYQFTLLTPTEIEDDDSVFEKEGAKIAVDECSLELLRGSTVDFEEDMMRAAFVITENPLAQASCGCGSSFQAKDG